MSERLYDVMESLKGLYDVADSLGVENHYWSDRAAELEGMIAERDELIRDMARELRGLNDGGIATNCMEYEQRMRELGVVGE